MKTIKFLLVGLMVCLAFTTFAQVDSTYVKIANDVLTPLESKYHWIVTVLGVLLVLSEALASIPSVKANSVFQLVANWIKALSSK
jgi:hypothetical protein